MSEQEKQTEAKNLPKPENKELSKDSGADAGEFKVTVRKLEMPVRPRGVLAE